MVLNACNCLRNPIAAQLQAAAAVGAPHLQCQSRNVAVTAQALSELQRRLQSCPHGQGDEETQKWFLRDRKLDVGEAEQKLTDMLRWRQEFK